MDFIVEQLKRIADALDEQNRLEREVFECNKQLMEADIARQSAEMELAQQSSDIRGSMVSLGSIREEMSKSIGANE